MNKITPSTMTMASTDLLAIINAARSEAGEPEIRRNKFSEKVEDELDGEHYTKRVVQNLNGTESFVYDLTRDQCMLVAMRESKAVRRKVLDKLKTLDAQQIEASVQKSDPVEFAKLAIAALPNLGEPTKQTLLSKVSELSFGVALLPLPRVEEHLMNATEVGAILGISAQKVGRLANQHGLKTDAHGEVRLDKSKHNNKMVENFFYNQAGVDALRDVMGGDA